MKTLQTLFTALAVLASLTASSQCRIFVKNQCSEAMKGYIMNENFSGAKMMPGDEAEMTTTFYGGVDYRLMICHHPMLVGAEFQVIDSDNKVLYDNKNQNGSTIFDFRLAGTDQLTIKLKITGNENSDMNPQGCVAILLGKKENSTPISSAYY